MDDGIDKSLALIGDDLTFDEPTHTYEYKGVVFTSTTTVLKDYFPFDADGVAEKCSKGRNPLYAGKTVEEIKDMWMAKAQFGTDVHQVCEDYLNGLFVEIQNDREMKAFNYLQRFKFEKALPEVRIAAPEWGISGMIDCLVKINGRYWIYDWKTDRSIAKKAFTKGDFCSGVLHGFDNCNFNKFTFQLGIYRFILENVYDIPIAGCVVVHFPEHGVAKEYTLPYHPDYVEMIIHNFVTKRDNKDLNTSET